MVNRFLVLAYGFVWAIFMAYLWSLSRRQARLKKELQDLRAKIERGS